MRDTYLGVKYFCSEINDLVAIGRPVRVSRTIRAGAAWVEVLEHRPVGGG